MAREKKSAGAAREGFTLLRAPANVTAASAGGIEYQVVDGMLEVPTPVVGELLEHGFALTDTDSSASDAE
jgi:hypothetical protein